MMKLGDILFDLLIDVPKNRVFIDLYGYFSFEHIKEFVDHLNQLTDAFQPNTCSILVMENRLAPISQDNLTYMQKATEILLPWADKIAVVNSNRTLTHIQMKRIVAEVSKVINVNDNVKRFKTKNDALKYLNWV